MGKLCPLLICVVFILLLLSTCEASKKKRMKGGRVKNKSLEQTTPHSNAVDVVLLADSAESSTAVPEASTEQPKPAGNQIFSNLRNYSPYLRQLNEADQFELGPSSPRRTHRLDDPFEPSYGELDFEDDLFSESRPNAVPEAHLPANVNDNYEDLLFDDYQNPEEGNGATTAGAIFLLSEVCGQQFYCRRGEQGPCHRNEVFSPLANDSSPKKLGCSLLMSYPWNGCLPASKVGSVAIEQPVQAGTCTLRFQQRPCFGYPPTYRFHRGSNRCYQSNWGGSADSGPCSPNKIFVDVDGVYGGCRCRDRNHLLWQTDDRCYRAYTKGPCQDDEWLEPDSNGYSVCRKSPCPDKADGRHIYWNVPSSTTKNGCYKSFTTGPCRGGYYFIIDDYIRKKARCVPRYAPAAPYRYGPSYGLRSLYSMRPRPYYSAYSSRFNPWPSQRNFRPMLPPPMPMAYQDYDDSDWM